MLTQIATQCQTQIFDEQYSSSDLCYCYLLLPKDLVETENDGEMVWDQCRRNRIEIYSLYSHWIYCQTTLGTERPSKSPTTDPSYGPSELPTPSPTQLPTFSPTVPCSKITVDGSGITSENAGCEVILKYGLDTDRYQTYDFHESNMGISDINTVFVTEHCVAILYSDVEFAGDKEIIKHQDDGTPIDPEVFS
eukprot:UN25579